MSLLAGSATDTGGYQDGPAASAQFNEPFAISWAIHRPTNTPSLYVADSANHAIRRIDLTNLVVSTMWGGPGAVDRLNSLGIGLYERVSCKVCDACLTLGWTTFKLENSLPVSRHLACPW